MNEKDVITLMKSPKGTIIVLLDGCPEDYTCISKKDFDIQLNRKDKYIVTPLTYAIDNYFAFQGYKVIVKSENTEYCLNTMLLGLTKENEKELRAAHNAERLFLSGCYNIKTNWRELNDS